MLKDQENTRKQGDVGVGAAIAWFTRKGYNVSIPLSDSQKYDLIVDNGKLNRVQVKTTRFKRNNRFEVMLKTCGGNKSGSRMYPFDGKNSDLLFILTEDNDKYLIPSSVAPSNKMILGQKYEEYLI